MKRMSVEDILIAYPVQLSVLYHAREARGCRTSFRFLSESGIERYVIFTMHCLLSQYVLLKHYCDSCSRLGCNSFSLQKQYSWLSIGLRYASRLHGRGYSLYFRSTRLTRFSCFTTTVLPERNGEIARNGTRV